MLTYPLLAGMGITAGEEMRIARMNSPRRPWLWKTYGEGIRDALKLQPGRDFRLIHRYHQTALPPILEAFKPYPSLFDLSFKYSVAHMLSSPAPPFAKESLEELPRQPAHVDDGAQRRHLQFPLGRPGICAHLCQESARARQARRLLHGSRRHRLGPGFLRARKRRRRARW